MNDTVNIYAQYADAGSGDISAQRALARQFTAHASHRGDMASIFCGLVFARMVYAQSGNEGDAGLMISLLALGGKLAERENAVEFYTLFGGEAMAIISLEADKGVAEAEGAMPRLFDQATPEQVDMAKQFRALLDGKD